METPSPSAQSAAVRNRLILLAVWVLLYSSFALLTPSLLDDADSVHAEVSREILLRHDWVTLYANGIRYLEKSPLLYWSMAASFKLFGVRTAAARLPLALTVLGLTLLLSGFATKAFNSARAGLYAGLITLSSFGIFIFTRITIPDADVCLWLTLAIYAYYLTEQNASPKLESPGAPSVPRTLRNGWGSRISVPHTPPDARSVPPGAPSFAASSRRMGSKISEAPRLICYLFATACALNVLTKGLIGIVFPTATVLTHLLITRGLQGALKRLRQLHPITSTAVFFAIAAPWHILIARANPTQGNPGGLIFTHGHWQVPLPTDGNVHGWAWFYFVNEHLLRYLNLRVPRDYDTVPLYLFWGLLFIWIMPWSAYLFHAAARIPAWKTIIRSQLTPRESTLLLIGLWAAIPLLFFSLSTRQEYYVLPAIPALALLIAAWLNEEATEAEAFTIPSPRITAGQRVSVVLLTLGSLAALAAGFIAIHSTPPGPNTDLASLLQQNPADYALSFGHFLDLNAQAMGAFRQPLIITAIALFAGTLANWLARRNYKPHAGNLWLAAAAIAFLLAAHIGLQIFSPVLTSRPLADALRPLLKPAGSRLPDIIVINGEYEAASTLGFYLSRPNSAEDTRDTAIHILNGRSSNLWYGSFFPDAPPIFEDEVSLSLKWSSDRRVFLWQDLSQPTPKLPGNTFFIAQSGGKEILSNQPNPF